MINVNYLKSKIFIVYVVPQLWIGPCLYCFLKQTKNGMNFCVSFINHDIYKPLGGSKFGSAFHSSEIDFILLGLFNRGDHFLITAGFGIEVCDCMCMPLYMPKTTETCKKSMPCLIKKSSRCVADHIFKTSRKQCQMLSSLWQNKNYWIKGT